MFQKVTLNLFSKKEIKFFKNIYNWGASRNNIKNVLFYLILKFTT